MRYSRLSNILNNTCYVKNNDNTCYVGFIGLFSWLYHLDYGKFTCERYPGSIDYIQQDMEVQWLIDAMTVNVCGETIYVALHVYHTWCQAWTNYFFWQLMDMHNFEVYNGVLMTPNHHFYHSHLCVCHTNLLHIRSGKTILIPT